MQVNIQSTSLKSLLVPYFVNNIRASVPKEQHSTYIISPSSVHDSAEGVALGMKHALAGYVYLVVSLRTVHVSIDLPLASLRSSSLPHFPSFSFSTSFVSLGSDPRLILLGFFFITGREPQDPMGRLRFLHRGRTKIPPRRHPSPPSSIQDERRERGSRSRSVSSTQAVGRHQAVVGEQAEDGELDFDRRAKEERGGEERDASLTFFFSLLAMLCFPRPVPTSLPGSTRIGSREGSSPHRLDFVEEGRRWSRRGEA